MEVEVQHNGQDPSEPGGAMVHDDAVESANNGASPNSKVCKTGAGADTTPTTTLKKSQSTKKADKKPSSAKKAEKSPAASGMRGISFFMVPMAKKPKAESGSPAKEACSTATEKEQGNETSADQAPSPVCNDDVTTVQNSGVVSAESKVVSGAGKSDAVDDVVDLVSPQGSPSKAQPKQQSEDRGGQEPVAKRQCLRYNEAQTRKLEAFFKLGKETVDFAAIAAELDGLDEGRPVTKDNVLVWWNNRAKAQKARAEQNDKPSTTTPDKSATQDAMEVEVVMGVTEASSNNDPSKESQPQDPKSNPIPSMAENLARLDMLRHELTSLGLVKLSGDAVPSLRPSASDMINDFDLDAIRKGDIQTIAMKTRQVMARFLEGSARSSKEVATLLLGGAANKPSEDDEADCVAKIEECIKLIAHLVERRPKILDGKVQKEEAVKRWEVKDQADIPERCRALVETHRKMELALCERIKLIDTLMSELSPSKPKSTTKLEKQLVQMKDKYLKLEEKERKERDKLEVRLEADRKKQQQRDEKEKEKERKKAEESKVKEVKEVKVKDAKLDSKDVAWKPSDKSDGKPTKSRKVEPVKNAGASIMSFFGKPSGGAATKSIALHQTSTVEGSSLATAGTSAATSLHQARNKCQRRNFPAWERPKNAVVAAYPYGPTPPRRRDDNQSAASADLASWLAVLRCEVARKIPSRPLRDDGKPHTKLKLIQVHMKVALTRTQLIDVDVDAEKKIYWDIEWDDAEEKYKEIMADIEEQPDGLLKHRGRLLQMKTEGGNFYDGRRPPYYGTHSKISKLINPCQPLVQDPELDYSYDTDADWESEMGDGEDIGSDLDGDEEEEEEEEDGGFVVPDGYGSDDCEGDVNQKNKKRKLEKVVYYRNLPPDLAELLTVQVLDKLPLCLSSDPNVHLEENTDYYGEDITSCKAKDLDTAIQILHKHPTAVAFTYILPDSEHKLNGTVFLKGKKPADDTKSELLGVVSGYIVKVPESKSKAVWKEMLAGPSEISTQPAAKIENSSKQLAASKLKISDEHLLAIVKLVHGSARSKNDLVQELMEGRQDIPKSRAEKIIATVAQKKVENGASRWVLLEETLKRSAFIAEIAKEAWKVNTAVKIPAKKTAPETSPAKDTPPVAVPNV